MIAVAQRLGTGLRPADTLARVGGESFTILLDEVQEAAIIQSIVTLAHTLNMDIVAEGVENATQLAQLRSLQVEYGQGYFFARPLDAIADEAMIVARPLW